jgi:hypothetical protein
MEITTDSINSRKKDLITQSENLKATLSATIGAIQDCDYWLAELDKEKE